jgi:hydrogenase maturation protein HypF
MIVTRQYRVRGAVQGVGFRPFIHRLAREHHIVGWVLNDCAGVLIHAQGSQAQHRNFVQAIERRPPPAAVIASIETTVIEGSGTIDSFSIRESVDRGIADTLVPPDLSVCQECLDELLDPSNRRYRYAFINCTNCGPRYSIIADMPYDRSTTTMAVFNMCAACAAEYHDVKSRRFHAQANACPVCGPRLSVHQPDGSEINTDDVLVYALDALRAGRIVAVKSLGGFHLAVNARSDVAVRELRRRKRRDCKPFALLVRDVAMVRRISYPSDLEIRLLTSTERPITLVRKRPDVLPETVAPRNPNFGVMLPSTPLHYLLLDDDVDVLVMTSGNISGRPIEFTNHGAFDKLRKVADLFLIHNRDIHTRIDDSIVKSTVHPSIDKPLITYLRRARGYAPYPVHLAHPVGSVLAYGAELKSTIALGRSMEVYLSQHIGDLTNHSTQNAHAHALEHLAQLLKIAPATIACDLHPLFNSSAKALENSGTAVIRVQHHHAHMAGCMAENGIREGTAMGVILDGAGYGADGTIWGGEFLVGDYKAVTRCSHLRPFRLLGGDAAVRQPFRVAVALLQDAIGDGWRDLSLPFADHLVDGRGALLDLMFKTGVNSPITTSMGRLFDGVAALLGVCTVIEYEAQAAIELEALLNRDFRLAAPLPFAIVERDGIFEIDHRPVIVALTKELEAGGFDTADLSRRFHSTVVAMIVEVSARLSSRAETKTVLLSGGVFMNEYILTNAIVGLQSKQLDPHWHSKVPPNDGGLSLGQVVVADAQLRARGRLQFGGGQC